MIANLLPWRRKRHMLFLSYSLPLWGITGLIIYHTTLHPLQLQKNQLHQWHTQLQQLRLQITARKQQIQAQPHKHSSTTQQLLTLLSILKQTHSNLMLTQIQSTSKSWTIDCLSSDLPALLTLRNHLMPISQHITLNATTHTNQLACSIKGLWPVGNAS